jgi:pentatricopeptide repeat protein
MEFSSLLCSLAKSRRAEEAAALLRHLQRLEEPMGGEKK